MIIFLKLSIWVLNLGPIFFNQWGRSGVTPFSLRRKGGRLIFGDALGRPAGRPYRTRLWYKTKHIIHTPSLRDTPLKRGYETNNEVK